MDTPFADHGEQVEVTRGYDGHAEWYEQWAHSAGADAMAAARAALDELVPEERSRSGPTRALPLPDRSAQLVFSVLTHTDLEDFCSDVEESVRILAPGGSFLYVGLHPCFVHPFAEQLARRIATASGLPAQRLAETDPVSPETQSAVGSACTISRLSS